MIIKKVETEETEDIRDEEVSIEAREMKVNLNSYSIVSLDSSQTIKLKGEVIGRTVVVLVDSETTHNFLSDQLVDELRIPKQVVNYVVVLSEN